MLTTLAEQLASGEIDRNGYYDKLTEFVMQRVLRPNSVCVDVGTHEGAILTLMMKYAPQGTFYAFEPLPGFYAHLVNVYAHRVNIFNVALSYQKGTSRFNHVVTNPGYSGFKKRRYDREETDTSITVKTNTLDNILKAKKTLPDFIKIDVEGAELWVLRGARISLIQGKPVVVFEHGLGAFDRYGYTPEDVFEFLGICGLNIYLMDKWLNNEPPLSREEFHQQVYADINYYFIAAEAEG